MKRKAAIVISLLLALCLALSACGKSATTASSQSSSKAASSSSAASSSKASSAAASSSKASSAASSAASSKPAASSGKKVAVFGNKRGSSGFMDEAYSGADKAASELGVTVDVVEITETADYETQGRFLAESGKYDLLIFVGSNVADVVGLMAGDYPDQKISIVDTKLEGHDNVRSVGAKDPEQAFLSGVLSGLVTTGKYASAFPFSNDKAVLSYAGGGDNPTSRAGAAGFMAGALYVNPSVDTIYTIVGSYSDPDKAKSISLQGIERGADICTGNCGSGIKGVLEACKEQKAYYIATSPSDNNKDFSLCCSVKKTDVLVYNEIKSIVDGTWKAGYFSFGIADGVCDISFKGTAFEGKIPQELQTVIDDVRKKVVSGEIKMPTDPNDLKTWSAANVYKK